MKYFEVNNDMNHLQIDDTYMNLYMTRKIKLAQTDGSIQFQNNEVIGAIGNGTNTINGYCSNSVSGCEYKIDSINNAYIYLFATEPVSSSSSGMQVFDETGKLIFDANHKQAKVIGVGTTAGTIIGENIAIAAGGKTVKSEKSVETVNNVDRSWGPDYTQWDPKTLSFKYNWKYSYVVKRKTITTITEDNVYIYGGVISTKTFTTTTNDSGWKVIAANMNVRESPFSWLDRMYPAGIISGTDKSSGVISAFSYIVINVDGL